MCILLGVPRLIRMCVSHTQGFMLYGVTSVTIAISVSAYESVRIKRGPQVSMRVCVRVRVRACECVHVRVSACACVCEYDSNISLRL